MLYFSEVSKLHRTHSSQEAKCEIGLLDHFRRKATEIST